MTFPVTAVEQTLTGFCVPHTEISQGNILTLSLRYKASKPSKLCTRSTSTSPPSASSATPGSVCVPVEKGFNLDQTDPGVVPAFEETIVLYDPFAEGVC